MSFSQNEYSELKQFLAFYSERYLFIARLPPEMRPIACLEELERRSFKMAAQGLRQAINDIVERSRQINQKELQNIDRELNKVGVVTLSNIRKRFSRDYSRIVKRGKLNNDTDYYLIRNVINDDSIIWGDGERDMLISMILAYEEGMGA